MLTYRKGWSGKLGGWGETSITDTPVDSSIAFNPNGAKLVHFDFAATTHYPFVSFPSRHQAWLTRLKLMLAELSLMGGRFEIR
jgi:hypothetical protein